MDVKGGCCVARYAGNAYDLSRMDRIMLRFRPIAPKPASNGAVSGNSESEKSTQYVKSRRGKRKYVRNNNNNRKRNDSSDGSITTSSVKRSKNSKKAKSPCSSEENESRVSVGGGGVGEKDAVVTLPLLPETPERGDYDHRPAKGFLNGAEETPLGFNFWAMAGAAAAQPSRVAESWVHVECITETWVNGFGSYGMIGWADREMLMDLERDPNPGFVSNGLERVVWVNKAYREMAAAPEVSVQLVIKEGLQLPARGFTCTVRVVTCGVNKEKTSRTLPCDVWRLEGGSGFAWRLDVKAALSLGR